MTDKAFREWISRQPSCLSGGFSEFVNGEGRNPACHVRRSSTSGTGFKAPYACVPLTSVEHALQHQRGEAACLEAYLGGVWTAEAAKAWFNEQVAKYRAEWEQQTEGRKG